MNILKFGGTSLGSPERMKNVCDLITGDEQRKIVVLSAVAGTTNQLYQIGERLNMRDIKGAGNLLINLQSFYSDYIAHLFLIKESAKSALNYLDSWVQGIENLFSRDYDKQLLDILVSNGEELSTSLISLLLLERKIDSKLISALDFMLINEDGEPDLEFIRKQLNIILNKYRKQQILVTQGFICRDQQGRTTNLKRGGSDYSASIIGVSCRAQEIQIWTDIDGMHNNDPREVEKTYPLSKLSFDEAAELAYFGAKILHPATLLPAKRFNIPVRVKNTLNPGAEGTLISKVDREVGSSVKAIAAKNGITAIKIRSSRMLLAYGFLRKVFEIFEKYKTPIDMITTSEVAVSITVDDTSSLFDVISELEPFGEVEVDYDQTIICVVGNLVAEDRGVVSKIFKALEEIPIRMISYGGSKNNISILVGSAFKRQALIALNKGLFKL